MILFIHRRSNYYVSISLGAYKKRQTRPRESNIGTSSQGEGRTLLHLSLVYK